MALKGDRHELQVDLHFFCNTAGNRGGIVSISTGGSGVSMDQSNAVVAYAATSSGALPVGLLLQDVVSIDQTRQHINFHRDEVQVGSKVAILRKGYVVTDQVVGSPTAGQVAVLSSSGTVAAVTLGPSYNVANQPTVGQWLSSKDADGYATLSVNL